MIENLGEKANTNGFDKRPEDATKGGRKPSIKKQLEELLESEGQIRIESRDVISIGEDGSVILKLPTQMQLAMKLSSWAMSKRGNDSLKAIQMIMEQVDGKGVQPIDIGPNMGHGMQKVKIIIEEYKRDDKD